MTTGSGQASVEPGRAEPVTKSAELDNGSCAKGAIDELAGRSERLRKVFDCSARANNAIDEHVAVRDNHIDAVRVGAVPVSAYDLVLDDLALSVYRAADVSHFDLRGLF